MFLHGLQLFGGARWWATDGTLCSIRFDTRSKGRLRIAGLFCMRWTRQVSSYFLQVNQLFLRYGNVATQTAELDLPLSGRSVS